MKDGTALTFGHNGGSCTCSGGVGSDGHVYHDSSRCPIHSGRTTQPLVAAPSPMPRPWKCPVCQGVGTVDQDFYSQIGMATGTGRIACRSCNGRGIVIA